MIFDAIQEWFQELLIDGIISNLTGMFDTLNTKVGEIAGEVGMTPSAWNSGIFNMVRSLSETVIVPIAGIVLTFVMCYELIQLIVEKNNLHDFDTWIFFKWIFKTFCAVLIVTNTWNIVMAVFDVAQNVVSQSAGVIISDAGIDISGVTAAQGAPARHDPHAHPMDAEGQAAEYPEPEKIQLPIPHAGGFENTVQQPGGGDGQNRLFEKVFDGLGSRHWQHLHSCLHYTGKI